MNFNLVSPYDSAEAFTARFKEDVQIPKNSSVYLNYAKIERDRRVVLQEDNTIELLFDFPLPLYVPGQPGVKTMSGPAGASNPEMTVNIPKGTYSAVALAEIINQRLQTLFNREDAIQNTRGMYNCGPLNIINFKQQGGDITELVNNRGESGMLLSIVQNKLGDTYANAPKDDNGLQPTNTYLNTEFVRDPNNHTNDNGNAGNHGNGIAYAKTAGGSTYDNYAISAHPLQHYSVKTFGDSVVSNGTTNTSIFVGSANNDIANHIKTAPRVRATTRRILENIDAADGNGKEFCGLYSQPYASGLPQIDPPNLNTMGFSADPARTRGTGATNGANPNPRLEGDGVGPAVPVCYFGVEVGGQNGDAGNFKTLKIYGCGREVGGIVRRPIREDSTHFPHGGTNIDRMILLKTIALDDVLDHGPMVSDDDQVSFAIIPHYKKQYLSGRNDFLNNSVYEGFVNRVKLHFSVCLKTTSSGWKEVYDTSDDNDVEWYIWGQVLEGANRIFEAGQSKDLINMNIPFHPLLSSTSVNGGWERVSYTAFDRGPDNTPKVLIDRVKFKFSAELSSYIDSSKIEVAKDGQSIANQYTSHTIYPTLPHYTNDFFPILPFFNGLGMGVVEQQFAGVVVMDSLYADTSDDAYVIYINNLPLKNYKNTRNSRLVNETKGGYNKNILANVPLPYQTEYRVDNRLIGYYEPYLKAITDMKNQNFKTNYFDIEIRNALDDSPASYLRSAVINFTIVDKKSKLIN